MRRFTAIKGVVCYLYENRLIHESSPYLLQHAHQPVDWYPWGEEAFAKAQREDKPVFLSIGYSTCHWCHVMAHESFDDTEIAKLLCEGFVSIKVDREERPDLDSVYMAVCQAMTGSGGWPMSIFLTPEKKPFFAGTYFPKDGQQGMIGFRQLLYVISQKWTQGKWELLQSADKVMHALSSEQDTKGGSVDAAILGKAVQQFHMTFDERYGGFGEAPKFPTAHNLLFLLDQYCKTDNLDVLHMTEVTLQQMYRGGLFDHIGFGFSRYSTDRAFQIPHFEKMLYDNALLMMAYTRAYDVTGNGFYLEVAEQTADYILREMTSPEGGFYSAQDADSEGVEGRYYAFRPPEICQVLSAETANAFNRCYGITQQGNFEGQSIPHLVGSIGDARGFADCLPKLRAYRRQRSRLHLDDKILTAWNALMIAALSQLARLSGKQEHRAAALRGAQFLRSRLQVEDRLYASYREGVRGGLGYLDDYAFTAFALIELYQLVQEPEYLEQAQRLCSRAMDDFWDAAHGGFYLSGKENEQLILQPKETYDGAIPSGNSVMAYNLVRLSQITSNAHWKDCAERQLKFLSGAAMSIPMGHAFYLLALSAFLTPPEHVTVVLGEAESATAVMRDLPLDVLVTVQKQPSEGYTLLNGRTTYYVCTGYTCQPPTNEQPYRRR
ncbi:MAG: thioredoxin domain-containing protein [Pseudoflavonifractor sp.]|nr:thioredoxin domain-containing protein [Pseudoflavonifractor sp.]